MHNGPRKILIADADQELYAQISSALGSEKYSFEQAVNGEEVLLKMQQFMPQLLFVELRLDRKSVV